MIFYYYVLLTFFAVIAALIILDPNIAALIDIQFRLAMVTLRKTWILTRMYPSLMLDKWRFQRALKKHRRKTNGREN